MAMGNSHVACARQMHFTDQLKIYWMHRKFTGCTAVHFTDAWEIHWMHGCSSAHIKRVHVLHGANSFQY